MNRLQKIGGLLFAVAVTTFLIINTLNIQAENILPYLKLAYRLIGLAGLLLLIPWEGLPYILYDNKEFTPNENNRELIEKLRFRALLLKNLSVIILFVSVASIITGFYILINPSSELLSDLQRTNNQVEYDLAKDLLWNNISIRFAVIFLLIFLIQVLFRVFRYVLRLSAYYDGLADSIELYLMNENIDLAKTIELFTPDQYDIRELKQSSISDTLMNLLKTK